MKKNKPFCLLPFFFGGVAYCLLELLWRRKTHPSMFCAGGLVYTLLNKLFKKRCKAFPMWKKCMVGSMVITSVEYLTGCLVNLKMKLNVWDYSKMPFNFKGQICLLYSFLWALLTMPVAFFCAHSKNSKICKWLGLN